MSPLDKRIAYKKKSSFSIGKYLLYFLVLATIAYLLFYHRFNNKTIYERAVGFFKSELEKSPNISIIDADKEIKNVIKNTHKKDTAFDQKNTPQKLNSEKDEIEEVIKKKLQER
ncbi:MAG: hypothetical protein N2746_10375 [Deltaproteobacteria bacterium]|nr:hypothetical protein [Deltaproteobacteria bacterium]